MTTNKDDAKYRGFFTTAICGVDTGCWLIYGKRVLYVTVDGLVIFDEYHSSARALRQAIDAGYFFRSQWTPKRVNGSWEAINVTGFGRIVIRTVSCIAQIFSRLALSANRV